MRLSDVLVRTECRVRRGYEAMHSCRAWCQRIFRQHSVSWNCVSLCEVVVKMLKNLVCVLFVIACGDIQAEKPLFTIINEVVDKSGVPYYGYYFPIDTVLTVQKGVGAFHAKLSGDFAIHPYQFKKGQILFFSCCEKTESGYGGAWMLTGFVARQGQEVNGFLLNGGESVGVSREKVIRSISFGYDRSIGGLLFKGNSSVVFHENGHLASGWLAEPSTYEGLTLRKGKISFYPNDQPQSLLLADSVTYRGMVLQANTEINFYQNGRIKSAVLAEPKVFGARSCGKGWVRFPEDGGLEPTECATP